jgi:hypothetical protein
MFVPSLSWQNGRFYIKMAQKCRFSQGFDSMRLVLFRDALLRALQPQQVPHPSLLSQLFGEGGLEAVRNPVLFHCFGCVKV